MAAPATPDRIARLLVDPAAYGEMQALQEGFTWLRANAPISLAQVPNFDPFWVVTKHADIKEISRQNHLFHSGDRATVLTDQVSAAMVRQLTGGPHLVRSLVQMDPPDHPKYRSLTQSWFTAQSLKRLEDRIRGIARAQVDHMLSMGGTCDFARDVSALYPLRVIMEILGVPREDEPRMLMLTQQLFGSQDPELNRARGVQLDLQEAVKLLQSVVADFSTYFGKITLDRRACPRDDVASVIANGKIDGCPIAEFEAMGYYIIVAAAGHDTTSSSTAGALWALCEHPDEFAKLKANPALMEDLVEEAIRWTVPVQHFMRNATDDYELHGHKIVKGDWLMLCYLSGNRDEEVFDDPFTFRVDRNPNRQIAFGFGAHVCLGQHLARMEMRILFEELLPKLKTLELAGTPKRAASTFVSGPKTLPIRYTVQ